MSLGSSLLPADPRFPSVWGGGVEGVAAIRGELKYHLGLHLLPCFARHCTSPKVLSGARQEFTVDIKSCWIGGSCWSRLGFPFGYYFGCYLRNPLLPFRERLPAHSYAIWGAASLLTQTVSPSRVTLLRQPLVAPGF